MRRKILLGLFLSILSVSVVNTIYGQAPTVTSFSPNAGPVGTLVTLNGTNLNNPNSVTIGGVPAIIISNNGSQLVAMVMPGAATGAISFNSAGGSISGAGNFSITPTGYPSLQQGNKLVGGSSSKAHQGMSVAISADEKTAIIGGPEDNFNQGAVWVFTYSQGVWKQEGNKLVGINANSSGFGRYIALSADGNTIIAAGDSYILTFIRQNGIWIQQGGKLLINNASGNHDITGNLSLSADGNSLMLFNNGHIYIFSRNAGIWSTQASEISAFDGLIPVNFLGPISISADANTAAAIGATGVFVFTKTGAGWIQQGDKLNNGIAAVALSADGNTILCGAINGAYVHTRTNNSWTQQGGILQTNDPNVNTLGLALCLSADGNTAVLGGPGDNLSIGDCYVFTRTSGVWTQKGERLVGSSNTNNWITQGYATALSTTGNVLIEGGWTDNNAEGASWIFTSLPEPVSNAFLKDLTSSVGEITPYFVKENLDYSFRVSNSVNNLNITPTAFNAASSVLIRINSGAYSNVINGTASPSLVLNDGVNLIEVRVTSEDGTTTKIYNITVTKNAFAPVINSFSPSSGPVGSVVTIKGANLDFLTILKIGGVPAIPISNNGTDLVAMVMPGATSGQISISNSKGSSNSATVFTVKKTSFPSIQQGPKLINQSNQNQFEGDGVAISADGNTAIVGAHSGFGGAYIYVRNGDIWTVQGGILDAFYGNNMGWGVTISADGNTVAVAGISHSDFKPAACVYVRNNGVWSIQEGDFKTDFGGPLGHFLVMSADGNTIIFGKSTGNSPISEWNVYNRSGNKWTKQAELNIMPGSSQDNNWYWNCVISADGNRAILSQPGNGVWVFTRNGNTWTQESANLNPSDGIRFGSAIAINADGNIAVISDMDHDNGADASVGAVYVFKRNAGNWLQEGSKIVTDKTAIRFGTYLGLSADGNTLMVEGNYGNNNQKGTWAFTNNDGVWTAQGLKYIVLGNDFAKQTFSLSADGTTAILGVPEEGLGGSYILVADPLFDAGNVSGGNSGGLESKSLGNAVVKRVYTKAQSNLNGPDDYHKMQKIHRSSVNQQTLGTGNISSLQLSGIMPELSSRGLVAYNSTPADITSITNAKDVLSTDFTSNQQCKAVAFATKTKGELYDHTKPICDRLKGASLENVEIIKIAGFDFVKYTIHNEKGQIEYATSFSIGTKTGRSDFSVQSTWLLKDYTPEENMFNFQLWAATPELVTAMVTEILNKLQAVAPVKSISTSVIPKIYIISGKREGTDLNLVLANSANNNTGYFLVEDKANEDLSIIETRKIPFTTNSNAQSTVTIPMRDNYESTITMYVDNSIKDVVYMSDGSWYADYNKATTSVSNFIITNDSKRVFTTDEYPVFRNVALKAVSTDYVSIVKLMKGGGLETDLSAFKGLKITASGGNHLHIVLVKNSIVNWNDQYHVDIKLDQDQKDYFIALDNFISDANMNKLIANDITTIVFSIETNTGTSTEINTNLSNISFTKEDLNYLNSLELKELQLFPNPVTSNKFKCNFMSSKASELTLSIRDNNGRLIQSIPINSVKGANSIPVNISANLSGILYVSLDGVNEKYQTKKLIVAK